MNMFDMKMPITMLKFEQNLFDRTYPFVYINPKKIVYVQFGKQFILVNLEVLGSIYFGRTKNNYDELKKIGISIKGEKEDVV